MNYRHLPLQCRCGEVPDHIDEVGFTDAHELVVHWWCSNCRRVVYVSKPLAECWRECPLPEQSLEQRLMTLECGYGPEDTDFLRSVGVRMP